MDSASSKRWATARKGGALLVLVLGVLYLADASFNKSLSRGLEETSRKLADSLRTLGFRRLEHFPRTALVVYGQDTVATLESGGELNAGSNGSVTLVLLGRWTDTERARVARDQPRLSGRLEVSRDSSRLVVYLEELTDAATTRAKGYIVLAPDSRWIILL